MGAIFKVNNNEGKHLVGYQCDLCGCNGNVDVIADSKFTGWVSEGEDIYCPSCYKDTHFECLECGKIEHCDNHCIGDLCEDCSNKINNIRVCDKCSSIIGFENLIECTKYNMLICNKCNNDLNLIK